MSDKEYDIPVKVVDRRWWANQEQQAGGAPTAHVAVAEADLRRGARAAARREGQAAAGRDRAVPPALAPSSRSRGCGCGARSAKDVERGRREILADLLDVVDNLDRALDAAQVDAAADRIDTLLQGVELVRRQFLAKLEGFGVKRIESEGQPFDPALHEAVSAVPAATPDQDGTVVGVIRHGYRIGDEVLRPAAVAVAKS